MKQKNKFKLTFYLQWAGMFILSLGIIVLAAKYHHQLAQFKSLGLFGIFIINIISSATIFLPTPGIAAVIAGGGIYPPILVALVASLGSGIGDLTSYLLGFSGKRVFVHEQQKKYAPYFSIFKTYGGFIIFLFALVPNPIFDAIGIVAGILGYPIYKYFLWMFVGRLIRNLLLAFFGLSLL